MKKFTKSIFLLAFSVLFLSAYCFSYAEAPHPKLVSEFEQGKYYKTGKIDVLVLKGTYRGMGRQYGALLKDEIHQFYEVAIEKRFIEKKGISYEMIKAFCVPAFNLYPQRLKEIMLGMAETSGMPLEKIQILEQILGITFLKAEEASAGCSALAAWDDYASGPLVIGRNYDSTRFFKEEFAEFLNLVIYRPEDAVPTAVLCYAGEITSFTGMNGAGIFFENNEAVKSGGPISIDNRLVFYAEQLTFLMDFSDMASFDAAMNSTRTNFAFIVNVTDGTKAWSYEVPTFGMRRRTADMPGLLAATNHFVDSSWGIAEPVNALDKSVQRREHLLALGNKLKGKINAGMMRQILDTPFDKGGATWPERTAYQVVAVPAELTFWLKLPGYQNWTEIELGHLFSGDVKE